MGAVLYFGGRGDKQMPGKMNPYTLYVYYIFYLFGETVYLCFCPLCFFSSQLASSSLLKIGQETDKTTTRNRESVYLLLDMVCSVESFLHISQKLQNLQDSSVKVPHLLIAYSSTTSPDTLTLNTRSLVLEVFGKELYLKFSFNQDGCPSDQY